MDFEPLSPIQVGRLLGRRRSRMQQGRRHHFDANDRPQNEQTARAKTGSTQNSKMGRPCGSKMAPTGYPKMNPTGDPKMGRQTESKMRRRWHQKLNLAPARNGKPASRAIAFSQNCVFAVCFFNCADMCPLMFFSLCVSLCFVVEIVMLLYDSFHVSLHYLGRVIWCIPLLPHDAIVHVHLRHQ